jgi:hypothetical protein
VGPGALSSCKLIVLPPMLCQWHGPSSVLWQGLQQDDVIHCGQHCACMSSALVALIVSGVCTLRTCTAGLSDAAVSSRGVSLQFALSVPQRTQPAAFHQSLLTQVSLAIVRVLWVFARGVQAVAPIKAQDSAVCMTLPNEPLVGSPTGDVLCNIQLLTHPNLKLQGCHDCKCHGCRSTYAASSATASKVQMFIHVD